MGRVTVEPWLTIEQLAERAAGCLDERERERWQAVALVASGGNATTVAAQVGVHARTVRRWVRLYNQTGSAVRFDQRDANGAGRRILSREQQADLPRLLAQPAPDGGPWTAAQLAADLSELTGRPVSPKLATAYARQAGFHLRRPQRTPVLPADRRGTPRRFRPAPPPPGHPVRAAYSSDLTDEEWAAVAPLLAGPALSGRPSKWPAREILNAIFYQARAGCAWRLLPHDLPPWKTVYGWFRAWRLDGTWERLNQVLRERVRQQAGREPEPSAAILDSQSTKTTEKGGRGATTRGKR